MDAHGIEVAITSLAQPGVGFGSEAEGEALARRCNDYAAELVARWPKRFGAFGMQQTDGPPRQQADFQGTDQFLGIVLMNSLRRFLIEPVQQFMKRPGPALLKAVLRTKHLMNPSVLALARRIVEAVVRELMEKLATEIRSAFSGARNRRPSRFRLARNFDMRRTLRANLGHYQPERRQVFIETPHFFSRTRKNIDQWQVILLVDQSGSMTGSVIHSAVTAACLWGLPGVKTHLVAFDTSVVDLTADVDDPVELLLKVQLGGGTDIAGAVRYGAQLIEQPRRAIVALITDFYEGGDAAELVRTVRQLAEQGTKVLGLAALDDEANPEFDRALAQRLADVGAHIGAMTPGQLANFVAECVSS